MTINGVVYDYPEPGDEDWGPEATDWAAAVTSGMLQKAGGLFQLLAEVDFGTAFGIKTLYLKSRTALPADAGQIRLARTDVINWRDNADSGNLSLGVSASDVLQFNGADIQGAITVSDTATIDMTLTGADISAAIVALSITNALVSASAAIDFSKLAALTSGNILVGSAGNVATSVAMSGDATIIASGALTIANNAVSNAKMAQMAQSTIKGRAASTGTGDPIDLSATQATAILNNFVGDSGAGGTKGIVPAPAAGDAAAFKFLSADGTWAAPAGAGDVVGPASSTDDSIAVFDGLTGKLLQDSSVSIVSGALTAPGALRSATSLILEDPGAGSNTTSLIAGTVSSSYSLTLPTAVAAANNSVLVSSTSGALTYVVAASANTASAIVQRDGSGNFSAGTITATLTGNATNVSGVVAVANGGTASSAGLSNNRVMISSGSAIVEATAITASRALASDANGIPVAATTTATELGYVNGVTSAIQTQINSKQTIIAASQVIRGTAASKGGSSSGDTTVVNYSTAISSTGSDITFTGRTTTTGDFYTINTTGRYAIWASVTSGAAAEVFGISINSSGTSTSIQSLATTQAPSMCLTASGNFGTTGAVILNLTASDIVRAQCESGLVPAGSAITRFGITRIG